MDGQLFIKQALTNMSQQYRNDDADYIQDQIAPILMVEKRAGKYLYYPKSNLRVPTNSLRTGKQSTPELDWDAQWKDYNTLEEHALKDGLTKDTMEQSQSPLDPMYDSTRILLDAFQLERENNLSTTLSNTSIVTQYAAPSVVWNASTGAGSPFIDIATGVNTMLLNGLKTPNTIFMGWQVWQQLANHPDTLDRIKYTQIADLTPAIFANLVSKATGTQINQVLIGKAVVDSSAEQILPPGTISTGFVWGKNLWLAYCTGAPALRTLNGMYTLVLRNGRYVDSWVSMNRKTTYVRVNDYYNQFVVGPEAFYMIQGAVS